jgi:hypothetical protein
MNLANMRSLGVRSVQLFCSCDRWAIVEVDYMAASVKMPNVRRFFHCSQCGKRPAPSDLIGSSGTTKRHVCPVRRLHRGSDRLLIS